MKFKKLFKKKDKDSTEHANANTQPTQPPPEGYVTMDGSSLYNMPAADLVEIIYKYDAEVKHLNQQISTDSEQLSQFNKDFPILQEKFQYFSKHSEELQNELDRVEEELKDTQASLESRKAELDLAKSQLASKSELVANYRQQVEDLRAQITELETENLIIPQSAGSCCADREAEIIKLHSDIAKLKTSLAESNKVSQEVQELRITNKSLESEIAKMSIQHEVGNAQIKNLNEKIVLIEKQKQEIEKECSKRQSSLESMEKELSKLLFQKESMETEILALRESQHLKETKYLKKQNKIKKLNGDILEKSNQICKLKQELEGIKDKNQLEMLQIIENCKKETERIERQYEEKIRELESTIANCKNEENRGNENNLEKLTIVEQQNKEYAQKIRDLNEYLKEQSIKISELEKENKNLSESYKKSQHKRELARQELTKLSQKLEHKTPEISLPSSQKTENFDFKLNISEMSKYERKALSLFRLELESLYKMLMKIMMGSNTTKKNGICIYNIKSDDFSAVEKRLNNIVMQVHEALDTPETDSQAFPIENTNSWSTKLSHAVSAVRHGMMTERGPVKLFSCMSSQEEFKGNMIPKSPQGKRLMSNTGGEREAALTLSEPHRNSRRRLTGV
ncbi:unnamed protein product [Blepharisma stoltei]|uniref:Uncharacterized protein n=1 Tax=Blepharisma stoltei TaxID=1481888 RepID=A0AAU9IWV9_9CILI|nr:unnamed protein product [Blepharisma stoltei]